MVLQINLIVACDVLNGIALNGQIPWYSKSDMKYFRETTTHTTSDNKINAVLMGRKTWDSLPNKYKPLPNRLNIVLSKSVSKEDTSNEIWISCLSQLTNLIQKRKDIETVWVIGGSSIYSQMLKSPLFPITLIHKTTIHKQFDCDLFFNMANERSFILYSSHQCVEEDGTILTFEIYKNTIFNLPSKSNQEEIQYLSLVKKILLEGSKRDDRTGIGTLSLFGTQMKFNIRNSIPLLTTKRVFFRGVVEELLWFLRGETNVKILQDKNVKIWNGNSTPEYLKSVGLSHLKNGDLGPIYGFQWRHFGASYTSGDDNYKGKGVDQIAKIIHQIKHEPNSRRIILSAWNPTDIDNMALPPCHVLYQFYVCNGELSCHMYQRSGDIGLGVPFNIASVSVLTYIIAHLTNLRPGDIIHSLGDAHVYRTHIDALREQCKREPRAFPTLTINPSIKSIDQLQYSDFSLENYKPYSSIKMKMAV